MKSQAALIVVESPTKARTLSRFLGSDYLVEATMGHIKDLPKSQLGVDLDHNFTPLYVEVEGKKKAITEILKSLKKVDKVYLATDPDREGEAIAKHVEELVADEKKSASMTRIVFHEITKEAVEEAIGHPRKVDAHLVDAQISRRVLDRLVGYKLSPLLWKKVRRGLSAGRVQTVALRLIVEKEREIAKFKAEEYWEFFVDVSSDKDVFTVKLLKVADKSASVENKEKADKISSDLQKADYVVSEVVKREVKKNPYPPFTTSTMTQAAARFHGWSAKKTMSVAQKLYEEGLITYHRTDSLNLANQAVTKVREFIEKTYGKNYLPESPRFYKTKSKSAQEAHEAIRPTDVSVSGSSIEGEGMRADHQTLYGLIWRRFVACQITESIYDETRIDVSAKPKEEGLAQDYLLRASGQVERFDGWRKVIPLSKDEAPTLPEVVNGQELAFKKLDAQQKFTLPPARFNEASLIKTLEKLGIGRPSTYAPIISTIQIRQYVEKKEGRFFATPVGFAVCDFMIKNFPDVFDYEFTANMEDRLDKVAEGKLTWQKEIGDFWKPLVKKIANVEKNAERVKIETEKLGRKCPTCLQEGRAGDKQGELVVRTGRFGKFISCSLFPECKHTEKYLEKIDMKCPDCKEGEVIVKTTRKGRKFFGCSRYPDCEFASWTKPGEKTN